MTDLFRLTATEIAKGVTSGELSALAVARAHIDRITALNPSMNAIVQDTQDEALMAAQKIDTLVAQGQDPGPLAGVPYTIKVSVDQEGYATTNGLPGQKDLIATQDNPVAANLKRAGGVLVGRTNTPAYSLRWFTKNDLHGQTFNPRNIDLTPGGSSGGASSAVAAGFCAIGHGTDIGGSIRYPAYACGLHGLRPSFGRVPMHNTTGPERFIGGQTMAVSGPIARSIDDIRLALAAMSARNVRDPWYVSAPLLGREYPKRAALTIAPDGMPVATEVRNALVNAAKTLEDAGWDVEEVACPPMRQAADINGILWMAENQVSATDLTAGDGEHDAQFVYDAMCHAAGPVTLGTVMKALQDRAGLVRAWEAFFETYPLLICPVSGELPFEQQTDVRSEADFLRIFEAQLTQRGLPVMGMPALSVATGQVNGSPLGVQLVAGRFREDVLLDAGAVIETSMGRPTVADLA